MRSVLWSVVLSASALGLVPGHLAAAPPEPAPATIEVTLPADARLTVDGEETRSASGHRRFITPPLQPGRSFRYTFTARFVRADQTITVERSVVVQAGRETFVSLDLPAEASARADLPRGYASTYGAGSETSTRYAAPATAGSGSGPRWRLATRSEDRPYSPGFSPTHWGRDPSGPFFPGSEW